MRRARTRSGPPPSVVSAPTARSMVASAAACIFPQSAAPVASCLIASTSPTSAALTSRRERYHWSSVARFGCPSETPSKTDALFSMTLMALSTDAFPRAAAACSTMYSASASVDLPQKRRVFVYACADISNCTARVGLPSRAARRAEWWRHHASASLSSVAFACVRALWRIILASERSPASRRSSACRTHTSCGSSGVSTLTNLSDSRLGPLGIACDSPSLCMKTTDAARTVSLSPSLCRTVSASRLSRSSLICSAAALCCAAAASGARPSAR
mmetsp:Transcript_5075/g.12198  ORF Transcript_5075/g.12198 Transcript_5075/m.12198 type:complete len:273 (-) Transcript_5075:1330-2148(-)